MKIALIGGGWVSLHIINKFSHFDIDLFCKKDEIFNGSSGFNQNRLHIGFHYPRSFKTRNLCLTTFDKFKQDYGDVLEKVEKNYYAISNINSIIDFKTYISIYDNENIPFLLESNTSFNNLDGDLIRCEEMFIDPVKSKNKFIQNLPKVNHINKRVTTDEINEMSKNYDYIFICTNNELSVFEEADKIYELCVSLHYDIIDYDKSYNLLVMDGDFFSVFHKSKTQKIMTSVKDTPAFKFNNFDDLKNKIITDEDIEKLRIKMENRIKKYDKNFSQTYKFNGEYGVSVKVKSKNANGDDRTPKIISKDNIFQFITGKIQGIYLIEDFIKKILK